MNAPSGDRPRAGAAPADERWRRALRRTGLAWAALLVLLAASALAARLHLGGGNLAVSLTIALAKTGIVAWLYMQLDEADLPTRLAVLVGAFALLLLATLNWVDFAPRRDEPTSYQRPERVPARLEQRHAPDASPGRDPR